MSAFDQEAEDFDTYVDRCIGHMSIDFQQVCGSFNEVYLSDFRRCWCARDRDRTGFMAFPEVLAFAADLHALGYESWELDPPEVKCMEEALCKDGPVKLRDLCLYAEKDEEYVVGPQGQETVVRLVGLGEAPTRVTGPWSHLHGEHMFALAHLCVDLGLSGHETMEVLTRNACEGEVARRVAWYADTWRRYAGDFRALPWESVREVLREAVALGLSRFARSGPRFGHMRALEAAALLDVRGRSTEISFHALCCVVEAPEPWVRDAAVARAIASSAFRWSPQFHAEVMERLFPLSRFHEQAAVLVSSIAASGVSVPTVIWIRVIQFLPRNLQKCVDVSTKVSWAQMLEG